MKEKNVIPAVGHVVNGLPMCLDCCSHEKHIGRPITQSVPCRKCGRMMKAASEAVRQQEVA